MVPECTGTEITDLGPIRVLFGRSVLELGLLCPPTSTMVFLDGLFYSYGSPSDTPNLPGTNSVPRVEFTYILGFYFSGSPFVILLCFPLT